MKKIIILLFLSLSFTVFSACRNNPLRTNEKKLSSEILNKEKSKEEDEFNNESSKTRNNLTPKSKAKEVRSIDPNRPPITLNLQEQNKVTQDFKLSDVASSVTYIKLETPLDTILTYDPFYNHKDLISSVKVADGQIIFQGLFGITRFNMQGKYQETIWKNERGIEIHGGGVGWGGNFFGVMPNNPVSIINGNIYYSFTNGNNGTGQIMKYKPENILNNSSLYQHEMPGLNPAPGDTLLVQKQPMDRFDWIYGLGPDIWAGINRKWNAGKTGSLLVTYNSNGDTICQFTDFDRIENFEYSLYKRPVDLTSYYYNGLLTIKQEFNDTVFRLVSANRLLPTYIIDFGDLKVGYKQGLDPNSDLSEKLMLNSMHETSDFLLIRYTQNNDSPNNRKKNAVKYFNALFDKKQAKLFLQPGFSNEPKNLINDIDGGMPFWPDYISPQGEMMQLVSGRMIKDYLNSDQFRTSIYKGNRNKLITLGSALKPTDMVLILVK